MDLQTIFIVAITFAGFAAVSGRLERSPLTGPLLFAAFGLGLGTTMLGIIDLDFDHALLHGLAELTLVLVLFSDAARIKLSDLKLDYNIPLRMLLVGMPLVVIAGTATALVMPFGFGFVEAALLAAILAPTDAALGQAVVNAQSVPQRLRDSLNVESGLNDGLALPLVLLFGMLAHAVEAGHAAGGWFGFGLAQILVSPIAGVIIGAGGALLFNAAISRNWMNSTFGGAAIIAPALASFAGAEAFGGNGFIAAFVGGLAFGQVSTERDGFLFEFIEAEGQIFILLTFMIFGASLLPEVVQGVSAEIFIYALLSLTVIRMVPMFLSLIGTNTSFTDRLFLGWFGPRGLASILFAVFIAEGMVSEKIDLVLQIIFTTVGLSILLHGITAAPMAKRMGTR